MSLWQIMILSLVFALIDVGFPSVYNRAGAMHTETSYRASIPRNSSHLRAVDDASIFELSQSSKNPIFTPYWAVEVSGGEAKAKGLARKYGFVYLGEIMPGIYYFRKPRLSKRSLHHSIYYHEQLAHDPNVVWLEQQVVKVRVKRDVQPQINDPSWPHMWYLAPTRRHKNRGDQPGKMDMNVRQVWEKGYAGQGVVVTILDDGLETDHPDLKANYDPFASYDVNSNDDNPEPRYPVNEKVTTQTNRHGTRCAGEVAAVANNGICGLGIAYRARIGGVRMLDGDVSDAMESRSLGHRLQHIDVYSASWGPEDDGKTVDGPGRLAQLAFRNGIKMGRGGRGSIFVWASGNGGKSEDNCNCDGYTNSIYTLGVSSVSEHGNIPWYAEMCSSTLAVTYSSGGHGERGVITTDLNHTCTDNHSGTSASAPLAAGICALTLSANPRLTWRDLQYLVVYTSRPQGLRASDWRVNGVGRRVSHAFGYGLMDANAMVELALNWTNVAQQRVCEAQAPITGGPVTVRPRLRENLALTTDGCASAAALAGDPKQGVVYLEHVQAKVTVNSVQRGEIEIWLTSPLGTVSKLLSKRPKDVDVAGFHAWPFMSVHYWGERANGTWKLTVTSGSSVVSIHDWVLILYGTYEPPPMSASSHRRGVRQSPLPSGRETLLGQNPPTESPAPPPLGSNHYYDIQSERLSGSRQAGSHDYYTGNFPDASPYFYSSPSSQKYHHYFSHWYHPKPSTATSKPESSKPQGLFLQAAEGEDRVALFNFELPPIIDPSISLAGTHAATASARVGQNGATPKVVSSDHLGPVGIGTKVTPSFTKSRVLGQSVSSKREHSPIGEGLVMSGATCLGYLCHPCLLLAVFANYLIIL